MNEFLLPLLVKTWLGGNREFIAIGCEIIEGNGSRVAFKLNTVRADFHRPHPSKEAKPYQIRDARMFLTILGFAPEKKEEES